MNARLVEFTLPNNETLNIIVCVEFDGHQNVIKSVQLDDETARKLHLPATIQLGTNSNGEHVFYKYDEEQKQNYYFLNTPLIEDVISEILKKKDDIIQLS